MKKAGPDIWRIRIGLPLRALDGFATALEELTEACSWFLQDPAGNEEAPDELWWLDGFSRAVPDRSAIHSALALAAASMDLPAPEILIDSIADTDWVSANLRDFPPIRAGRFLVHGSHYQGGKPGGSLTLQIDAGTAFGSGEHATTFGCLTAIDRLLRRRRFHHPLDLGCGSGILAIALAKTCKRAYVLAADIDPEAVRVAAANARLNQAAAKLTARVADGYRRRAVTRRRPYDLVVANILARPLVAMAAGLGRHLTKDGIAILSGLLVSQERLVLAAHRLQGLSLAARIRVNGWSTLVLTRSPRSLSFIGTKPCKPTAEPGPLARLREALAQRQLDGFIVPHNDEYQGEYLPPSAERLAWLTGFSGSAGLAIIFARKAALFVDGRYTLQARQQVDETQFLLLHQQDQPPAQWLETALNPGLRLGYDPWLHTPDGIEPLAKACAKAGAALVPVGDNPLDGVWEDRPLPPMARVTPHALAYAGRSREDKQGQLAKDLAEAAADAVMLTAPDSIAWLLNLRGGDVPFSPLPLCFAMAHRDGSLDLFIDPGKCGPDLDGHLGPAVRRRTPSEMGPMLDRMAGKRVRLDPASVPVWIFERLNAAKASVEPGLDPCLLPKACKNAVELAGARQAHHQDGLALVRFLAWLEEVAPNGLISEMDGALKLDELRQEGALFQEPSFPTISAAGPNGAIVHYRATPQSNRLLQPGELYLVDSGGQYLNGTTDVTRTVVIPSGGTALDLERRAFSLVLKGHIALASLRFPEGTSGSQIDILARKALWTEGWDYDHGTGHGVGSYLSVHEGPQRISKLPNRQALLPGMILSDEPGYYRAGAFGIRIENLLAVRPCEGAYERPMLEFELLTLAPIDLNLIEPSLLEASEIAWLNAYHQRVRQTLTPSLDAKTAHWLAAATRPLEP